MLQLMFLQHTVVVVAVAVVVVVAIFNPKKPVNPSSDYWKPKFYFKL
jgi:hypothetical protein